MSLTLTDDEFKKLDALLAEVPAKYSFQPLVLLNNAYQRQVKEQQDAINRASTKQVPETDQEVAVD